jgi:hypothetical protein
MTKVFSLRTLIHNSLLQFNDATFAQMEVLPPGAVVFRQELSWLACLNRNFAPRFDYYGGGLEIHLCIRIVLTGDDGSSSRLL